MESETGAVGVAPHVEHGPHMFKGHDMEDIILCIKETTHLLLFGVLLFICIDLFPLFSVPQDGPFRRPRRDRESRSEDGRILVRAPEMGTISFQVVLLFTLITRYRFQ